MRRAPIAILAAVAVALTALAAAPVAADATSTPTSFTKVQAIAVDEEHGRVFVSGRGKGDANPAPYDYVEVFDLVGRRIGTIDGLPGAYGLTLNGPGTKLYVSLYSERAIAVIDTVTLAEVDRIDVGVCPKDLAVTSGVLVMLTTCAEDHLWDELRTLDLATEAMSTLGIYDQSGVAAAAGRVVVSRLEIGNNHIAVHDLTKPGSPVVTSRSVNRAVSDVAITPDGEHVLLAGDDQLAQLSGTDLTRELLYRGAPQTVSTTQIGSVTHIVAAGGEPTGRVAVYELGTSAPVTQVSAPKVLGAMEPSADLTRVFLSTSAGVSQDYLSVVYNPLGGTSTLHADVVNQPRLDGRIDLRGRVALSGGASAEGGVVDVRRHSPSGFSFMGTAEVDADGRFAFTDSATELGKWRYEFVYVGEGGASSAADTVEVTVQKKIAPLTFTVSDQQVTAGQSVKATVALGAGPKRRTVRITSDKYGGGGRLLATLTLQPGEPKTVRYEVGSRVALVASFAGDATYESRVVRRVVKAEVRINQTMRRWDDKRNGVHFYERSDEPLLRVSVRPSKRAECMQYHIQAKRDSGWKWLAYVECYKLNQDSVGGVIYGAGGERRTGTLYRVRSVYPGDRYHVRTGGNWEYFRFTR